MWRAAIACIVGCSGPSEPHEHPAGGPPDTGAPGPAAVVGTATATLVPDGPVQVALEVDVRPLEHLANGAVLRLRAAPSSAVSVACAAADGDTWSTEREAAPDHEVAWHGLLLDTAYACVASAGATDVAFELVTGPGPDTLPVLAVQGDTDGFTIVNHRRALTGHQLLVVDPQGRVRWYHVLSDDPNMGVEAAWVPDAVRGDRFLVGGGRGYAPRLIGRDALEAWVGPPGVEGGLHHHDVRPVADGLDVIVALSEARVGADGDTWEGFALETLRPETDERLWSWSSQTAVDRGQLGPHPEGKDDAYHTNSVQWIPDDPEGAAYWLSLRAIDQLARLDATTGDITWIVGLGGDFTLLEADGSPAVPSAWFFGQHAPEAHLRDPAGVWDVYVYDNGRERGWTRVVRLSLDVPARTATLAWTWTEAGWYDPAFGDVDLLPNGHLLITMGHKPAGPSDERVGALVELDPVSETVVWRADMPQNNDHSYRAQRIAACDLFPENVSACVP